MGERVVLAEEAIEQKKDSAVFAELHFLCLARNCAETLPRFFAYLDRLEAAGLRCSALIGENGSTDGSRQLLEAAAGDRISVLDTAFMGEVSSRLTRMAMGRQALLERTRSQQVQGFVCVADLDNVMVAPPDPQGLKQAVERLRSDPGLFAVGASSEPYYYDLLSLQAEGHDYRSLNGEIAEAKKHPASYFQFHKKRIYQNQMAVTRSGLMECLSSFNGFCVYNASEYYLGSYRAKDESEVCEHVNFNVSIAEATSKKMVIAPYLKIQMPADHGPVTFLRFWADRMKKAIR
jgi:hypothetical protein